MSGTLLKQEVRRLANNLLEQLSKKKCRNVTLSLDGWTDCSNNSIYVLTLQLDDDSKSCHVLCVLDLSLERHTARNLLGKLAPLYYSCLAICDTANNTAPDLLTGRVTEKLEEHKVPLEKLGAVVSDNPSVMNLFRSLFVEQPGYQHILQTR